MQLTHRTGSARRLGFTLIELLIAASLFAVVLGSVAAVSRASNRAYRTGSTNAALEALTVTAVNRVVEELEGADLETLSPANPLGDDAITYQIATGYSGGNVTHGNPRRIAFEYEEGEVDDGIDNNGNGLVDEGNLVLTEDVGGPNERRIILAHSVRESFEDEEQNGVDDNGNGLVDEHGFHVELNGETLSINLTLERQDFEGRPLTRTARTSIRLRN